MFAMFGTTASILAGQLDAGEIADGCTIRLEQQADIDGDWQATLEATVRLLTYQITVEGDGEDCFPYNVTDYSDDADALASAGMGTDEDYGYYGGDDY